jgi:hypothetical protein
VSHLEYNGHVFFLTYRNRAGALFNAVKKQYGLHSYLLSVKLPKPSPDPVPVPAALPQLPDIRLENSDSMVESASVEEINTLKLCKQDIQQIARFTREFLVMSLLPWMEKCVLDWSETVCSHTLLLHTTLITCYSSHPIAGYHPAYFPRHDVFLAQLPRPGPLHIIHRHPSPLFLVHLQRQL